MYHWDTLGHERRQSLISEQVDRELGWIEAMISSDYEEAFERPDVDVLKQVMDPMMGALQACIDHYLNDDRERARLPAFMEPVCRLGVERSSYLFVQVLLQTISHRRDREDLALSSDGDGGRSTYSVPFFSQLLSNTFWDMLSFFAAREMQPEFYREQSKYFRNWEPRRRRAFAKKVGALDTWTNKQRMKFARSLIEIGKHAGLIADIPPQTRRDRNKKFDRVAIVRPTDEVIALLEDHADRLQAVMSPTKYPLISRPLDLTEDEVGGWRSEDMRKRARYVTGDTATILTDDEPDADPTEASRNVTRRADIKRHSDASRATVNNLQRVEWTVNTKVHEVMQNFWTANTAVGRLPVSQPEPVIVERWQEDATPEEKKALMQRKAEAHSQWYRAKTARIMALTLLEAANQYKGRTFWHAWFVDFRGRFYSDSAYLNPQGCDMNRGLIQFATPYKVSKVGIYWLMVGLSNEMGFDKASFDDRVKWVKERMDLWKAIEADPYGTVREWEDDSKMKNATWSRLARILDLMEALRTGYSSLPVQLDGSCNGVQHWAAITRDKAVAEKVNLMDTPVPQDLYQFVADGCTELCAEAPNPWRIKFLEHWDGGMPRKVCKRSVMCDPYGISDHSVKTYVRQEGHINWLPKEQRSAGTSELGKLICESKEKQMRFINHGKKFVMMLTKYFINETNTPFWWRSPNGFEVINYYPKHRPLNISAEVWNKGFDKKYQVQMDLVENLVDEPNAIKAATAMPPNWIHSIDGAHMSLSVNGMVAVGIIQQSVIHDSFGCPAEDVPVMREIIKEQFYAIHLSDQLRGLLDHAEAVMGFGVDDQHGLFDHYQLGEYNIRDILDSEYAFG